MDGRNLPEKLRSFLKEAIASAVEAHNTGSAFSRSSPLSAEALAELLLTARGRNLESELRYMGIPVTRSALSKRRKLLPAELLRDVLLRFNAMCEDTRSYDGCRIIMACSTMVNTTRQGGYALPVRPLYDVMNKVYLDAVIGDDAGGNQSPVITLPRSMSDGEYRRLWSAPWGIEAAMEEQRRGLRIANGHGRSELFLRQELWASMIFSNFCSRIAGALSFPQGKIVGGYRINEAVTADLCRDFYRTPGADGGALLREIARYASPVSAISGGKAEGAGGFCFLAA